MNSARINFFVAKPSSRCEILTSAVKPLRPNRSLRATIESVEERKMEREGIEQKNPRINSFVKHLEAGARYVWRFSSGSFSFGSEKCGAFGGKCWEKWPTMLRARRLPLKRLAITGTAREEKNETIKLTKYLMSMHILRGNWCRL